MATKRFPIDWPLVVVALLLSIYGIAIVYSAGQTDIPTAVGRLWKTQLVWFGLALLGAYGASRCSVRLLDWLTWPAYFLSVAMLVLLLFIGKGAGTAASTKSWLAVGGFPSDSRRSWRRSPWSSRWRRFSRRSRNLRDRCSSCGSRPSSWRCHGC